MYEIEIKNCLDNSVSLYTKQFFKTKKEAEVVALQLANAACNEVNIHSEAKYVLHLGTKRTPFVAMIASPGEFFYTPFWKYYVEEIYDGEAITALFNDIVDEIDCKILTYYSELLELEHCDNHCQELCLYTFGDDIVLLLKPYFCNSETSQIIKWNMDSEIKYWIDSYKNKYTGETFVKECCQSIVFDLFCIIDGVSSQNDFKIEKTAFDKVLQKTELHQLWCEYLKEKNNEKL